MAVRTTRRRRIRHDSMNGATRGSGARKRLQRLAEWLAARAAVFSTTGTAAAVASVTNATNIVTVTTHGFETGDGPFIIASGGTVPGGTTDGQSVYVSAENANDLKLFNSIEDALSGANEIELSDDGTGAITLTPAETTDAVLALLKDGVKIPAIQAATDVDALIG